jgi:hypothetical protein
MMAAMLLSTITTIESAAAATPSIQDHTNNAVMVRFDFLLFVSFLLSIMMDPMRQNGRKVHYRH